MSDTKLEQADANKIRTMKLLGINFLQYWFNQRESILQYAGYVMKHVQITIPISGFSERFHRADVSQPETVIW
jgi:hypothetical protein